MKIDRFAAVLMLVSMLILGVIFGSSLGNGGTPAFAQMAGGHSGAGGYFVEEIQSIDEDDDDWKYNGRTLVVVTPRGNLKLVRITWKRQRGDDEDFPRFYAEAGQTYEIETLTSTVSLSD